MPTVIKADGTKESFKIEKLRRSLRKAGASRREITLISDAVALEIEEGMTTSEIYRRAFERLRSSGERTAARYSLRRALFSLGPTGFPFEDFLAKLFEQEGYKTDKRKEVKGKCARHELDVIAYKPEDCFVAEAKFHARPGIKSDLQVALYSYARFLDLKGIRPHKNTCGVVSYSIITNTKFTKAAVEYAECAGLNLLSWNYPKKGNLQDRVEAAGLYPVTVLQAFSTKDKQTLLKNGIVVCHEIGEKRDLIQSFGISRKRIEAAIEETKHIEALS